MRFRYAAASAVLTLLGATVLGCGSSGTPSTNADNFGWVQSGDEERRILFDPEIIPDQDDSAAVTTLITALSTFGRGNNRRNTGSA